MIRFHLQKQNDNGTYWSSNGMPDINLPTVCGRWVPAHSVTVHGFDMVRCKACRRSVEFKAREAELMMTSYQGHWSTPLPEGVGK